MSQENIMLVHAPFTEGQVANITQFQQSDYTHPFTCACGAVLKIRDDGFYCEKCRDYHQDWCHDFMADGSLERMSRKTGEAIEEMGRRLHHSSSDSSSAD